MPEANPNTFSGGLNMDLDPRLQPKNTYRDANNIKVVNTEGSLMTVQPIGGTAVAIDLTAAPFNLNTGNIVGYYSFADRLILMHVNNSDASSSNTRIYDFTLNDDGTFTSELDSSGAQTHSYVGSINMSSDITVKIVGILENQTLRRIYWTDNFNPVRTITLNLDAYLADSYPLTSAQISDENLELLPDMNSRSPIVKKMTGGSLPTGVYQYTVQYSTSDGALSSFSPLSILYHTSSNERGGSAEGEDSNQGFIINVVNPPDNFYSAKLYCFFYSAKDSGVQAMEIGQSFVGNGNTLSYTHTTFESNFDFNKILIPSNDFDLAKDLAIKDNILFAANTKKRDSFITESEFDAELIRFKVAGNESSKLRYLSSGEYVRANQDSGGYRYLPGNYIMKYSRGGSTSSNTTSIQEEIITQSPITTATTYNWTDTGGSGLPVNDINIELYNQSLVIEADSFSGGNLDEDDYLVYNFTVEAQTSSSGGSTWWNGSSWVAQVNELTFNVNGSTGSLYKSPSLHPSDGTRKDIAIYADLISLNLQDADELTGSVYQINITLNSITNTAPGVSFVQQATVGISPYTYELSAVGLTSSIISFNYEQTLQSGSEVDVWKKIRQLGAQSAGFANNSGVRVTFEQIFKKSDNVKGQPNQSPYIDLSSLRPTFRHEVGYDSNNQTMTKQINLDASAVGLKSFKRGEIYRLGILFYDKKGNPLNVKYMGDLQIPEAHDRAVGKIGSDGYYKPPSAGTRHIQEDFRLDTVIGQAVPSFCDYYETANVNLRLQDDLVSPSNVNQKSLLFYPYYLEDEAADRNFSHWTSDIYLKVDVRIKASTLNKISGFKIVRAERTEQDVTRGFQGLFRESQRVHAPAVTDSESDLGKTNQSNRTELKEALDDVPSGALCLNESIRDEVDDNATPETNGNTPVSYIFGSQAHMNYRSVPNQGPVYNIRSNKGMLYSPESIFGAYRYDYASSDRILPISVLKIKDLSSDNVNEPYGLKNENTNDRRFYGVKNISSSPSRRAYIAKTYTIDTQYFRLLDYDAGLNSEDGYKYYTGHSSTTSGSYYSADGSGNYTVANEAYAVWQNSTHGLALENALELDEGDTTTYTDSNGNTGTYHNKSYGRLKFNSSKQYDLDIADYDDTNNANTTYTRVPSIQKGSRGIFVECTGRGLMPPNINRAIYDNTLMNQTAVDYQKRPYLTLAEIKRDSTNIYGGVSDDALANTRYISCSDFVTTQTTDGAYVVKATGDIFVTLHSQQVTMSHYHPDASAAKWYVYPVETRVNTDMRSGKTLINGDTIGGFIPDVLPNRNDLLYNNVYSQENNTEGFFYINEKLRLDSSQINKIAYSSTKISGEKTDSFRNFPLLQFYDLDNESGEINSVVNFRDDLYVLQDRGFAKLYVNSRSLIGSENNILLGSANTIENHSYISKQYGTNHREGVMATDTALYFIDTANEKIHQFTNTLNTISDKGIMKFLTENLGKTGAFYKSKLKSNSYLRINQNELALNDEKGVSIGYDQLEKRVIFTLINAHNDKVSISYNEYLSAWESKLDFTPAMWILHKGSLFAHGRINPGAGISNDFQRKIVSFDNPSDYGNSQDVTKEQFIEVVINDDPISSKKFDALKIIGDVYDSSNVTTLTDLKASTDITSEQTNTFATDGNHSIREGIMKAALRGATATKRLVGSYAKVKITNNNSTKFSIFALIGKIRKSYK